MQISGPRISLSATGLNRTRAMRGVPSDEMRGACMTTFPRESSQGLSTTLVQPSWASNTE
jgi:hypothetical protein